MLVLQRKTNRKYKKTTTEREMKTASPTLCAFPYPRSLFPPYGARQLYYMRLSPLVHFYFIHFSCSSLPPVFCRTESVGCGPAPGARRSHTRSLVHTLFGGQPTREFIHFSTLLSYISRRVHYTYINLSLIFIVYLEPPG